eukprot:TRINITY_DN3964_c0_g2_i2.p1 TRINITY_DN3964_c0_g2~~TRINITY_DN3964_c0_g2_i2.p1  ORF type:complete len:1100 (-),score=243.40 TRINITY_DN3964_c0_g2_i2:167-3466(-)
MQHEDANGYHTVVPNKTPPMKPSRPPAEKMKATLVVLKETMEALHKINRKYNIHEWVFVNHFMVTYLSIDANLTPPVVDHFAIEEITRFAVKLKELIVLVPQNVENYTSNPKRRRDLQKLNNAMYERFQRLWKLERGENHNLIKDAEGKDFWAQAFHGRYLVYWKEFFDAIGGRYNYPNMSDTGRNPQISFVKQFQDLLDFSESGYITAFQFAEYLKGFGPLSGSWAKFKSVVSEKWFQGYISFQDTMRILDFETPGTFLIRLRDMIPGSFVLAFVLPSNKILQIVIVNNETSPGFKIKDDNQRWNVFNSLQEIVESYRQVLKLTLTSSLHKESWFYGDLTGKETEALLRGQSTSTFLLRFSAQHPHCLATAYVGVSGGVIHALITKSAKGYQHGEDRIFHSINDLITAYQTVLTFPYINTINIVEEISREILAESQEKAPMTNGAISGSKPVPGINRPVLNNSGHVPNGNAVADKNPQKKPIFKVFGVPLIEVMTELAKHKKKGMKIPYIAEQCIMYLSGKVNTPGLFRESASATEVQQLKESFDKGHDVDVFQCTNPHLIARLLKTYLHSLPDPLLPERFFERIMNIDFEKHGGNPAAELKAILNNIPIEHITVLKYLLKLLLQTLTDEARKHNDMDMDKLVHVIGPHILRDNNPTMQTSYRDSRQVLLVTKLLIENAMSYYPDIKDIQLDCITLEGQGIVLMPNRRQVKAATIEVLVETLYSPGGLIASSLPSYVPKFLLTYRSFMTSQQLLDLLIQKYHENNQPNSESAQYKRLRICNFMKKWTEEQYYEFHANEALLNCYKNFVGTILDHSLLGFLLGSLERLNKAKNVVVSFPDPPPKPIVPKKPTITKLTDLKPVEVARQMTLLESDMFRAIKPQELCEQAWMKADKLTLSPNVTQLAQRFNKMVWFIVTTVLQGKTTSKREKNLDWWIAVARACKELANYNGVMQVVAAITTGPLNRLLELRKRLGGESDSSGGSVDTVAELKELMSHENNWWNYREALKVTNPPLLPWLGCFQTDLVFIDEGMKIKTGELINFNKCYKVSHIIQQVQQYQLLPYNLAEVSQIKDWLLTIEGRSCDEEGCWQLSLQIQPKK